MVFWLEARGTMDNMSKYKLNHGSIREVKKQEKTSPVTIIYKEGDEFINENQQYQNGTNADESKTDSPTA